MKNVAQMAQLAQQQETQHGGAAAEDVAGLRVQMETHAETGAERASEAALQLSALESAQREMGTEVTAARSQLRLLSEGLAQANIALADVQDALEDSGTNYLSLIVHEGGRLAVPQSLYDVLALHWTIRSELLGKLRRAHQATLGALCATANNFLPIGCQCKLVLCS